MKQAVIKLLEKELKFKRSDIEKLIEIPPDDNLGDYAFPCFSLAKKLKKNPLEIAQELVKKLRKKGLGKEISNIEAKAGYVNFFIDKKILASYVLKNAFKRDFGKQKRKLKGMIEFSQANTHKAFHIGHIRGTSLGESLARIAEFFGEKVIRANYQGDIGMHVAKWIWCYNKYYSKEKLKNQESWIAGIYVDAVKKLAQDKTGKLQKQVEEINKKLDEKKDKKLMDLWKKTRKLSLDSLEPIYKNLDTRFDKYYFESEFEKKGKETAKNLLKKKIAKISNGAAIVDLEKYNLGVWVLLRKDGTVLYSAKDLALAERKFKEYKLDWSVYVHGNEQNLHFKQMMKTLKLMNFKNLKKIYHINYSLVRLPSGKMSSRTGENILYSDFKKEILDYAKKSIKRRTSKINEKELEKRALSISIAAIKYSMLKQDANKLIVFDKTQALNFEGDSGPYLLYSYARASSIIRKVRAGKNPNKLKIIDLKDSEIKLIKKIFQFPEIIEKAYENFSPSIIANYSYELAQDFNEFYHACPVMGSKEKDFRLKLVNAFRAVMKKSLFLLGIEVLEEM
jgi:arginyl-tRNA synthetase